MSSAFIWLKWMTSVKFLRCPKYSFHCKEPMAIQTMTVTYCYPPPCPTGLKQDGCLDFSAITFYCYFYHQIKPFH